MTERGALAAVVEELAAAPEAEQLALIPSRFAPGDERADRVQEAVRRHRAGRPPGARNLATRQALDYVRRVLGDPLIERARMAMHTPESLAIELGCTKLEAAEFIDRIRADLQRLFYAPLAPVDGEGNAVPPTFNLVIGGAPGGPAGARAAPWEYQQIQALGAPEDPVSHAEVSHEVDK